jgi:hypothetical protein
LTQKEEIFNPDKDRNFSFTCRDCFNRAIPFLKYYPEIILVTSADLQAQDSELELFDDPEKVVDMFIDKFTNLRGMKQIKKSEVANISVLENSKEGDAVTKETELREEECAGLGKRQVNADGEMLHEIPNAEECFLKRRMTYFTDKINDIQTIMGVFMREDLFDYLCKCPSCTSLYLQSDPLQGLLTDKYYEDTNYEEAVLETSKVLPEEPEQEALNSDMEFLKYMANKFKERTGREISAAEQLVMTEHYAQMKQRIGDMILNCGKSEITEADMRQFLSNIKESNN